MQIRLNAKPVKILVTIACAPTNVSEDSDKDSFYMYIGFATKNV